VVTASRHRLAMTELAVAANPHFTVDAREIDRPGNTYTVDTLTTLHDDAGPGRANLHLILGSDALADMPYWKTPERLFELSQILIARKGPPGLRESATEIAIPGPLLSLLRGRWSQRAGELLRFERLPETLPVIATMPALPVSSTLLRNRAHRGLPIRYLVPPEVEAYIAEQGLYGAPVMEEAHA
jgi:nicotinate-nucleotide adenylyltransferase